MTTIASAAMSDEAIDRAVIGSRRWSFMRSSVSSSCPEPDGALDQPAGGDAADRVRARELARGRRGQRHAARGEDGGAAASRSQRGEHGRDERQLADLDADVEEGEGEWNGARRQTDVAERARESEAVQQAEVERDEP